MTQYYDGRFVCSNCGWDGILKVEKGTRLEDAYGSECPNCGCEDTLEYSR